MNWTKAPLERDMICAAGLRILEEEGFDALSLRKIADALGVQTPALYWHVHDRSELYGLMAEAMLREALESIDGELTGREWLIAFGQALRAGHSRRRDSAKLVALVKPSEAMRTELLAIIMDKLMTGGLDHAPAFIAQSAVQSFTLGWSLFEGNTEISGLLNQSIDIEKGFDAALAALADGLAASL